jgi:hypothetical protein
VSENRELWTVFGPEREVVPGGWRNLYTEEVVKFTIETEQDNTATRTGSTHGPKKSSYKISAGNP